MATAAMPYDAYNEMSEEDAEGFLLLPNSPPDLDSTEMFPEISDCTMVSAATVEPAHRPGKSFAAVAATTTSVACTVPAKAEKPSKPASMSSRPKTEQDAVAVGPAEITAEGQETPERAHDVSDAEQGKAVAVADPEAFQVALSQRKKKDIKQDRATKAKQAEDRPPQKNQLTNQNAFEMLAADHGNSDSEMGDHDNDGEGSNLDVNAESTKPPSKNRGRRKSDTQKKSKEATPVVTAWWICIPVALLILLQVLYFGRLSR